MSASKTLSAKRRLFGLLLVLLLLPAVQTWLNIKWLRPSLGGYEASAPRPAWHWDSLRASVYQERLERYAAAHLGLREQLIRPRNQLAYSLFGRSNNQQIIIGQDGVLFEAGTVAAALGQAPPAPSAELRQRVQQFRVLQDTLARRGKLLVLAIPPSKAGFYAELLPAAYRPAWQDSSNYQRYAAALQAAGVNVVDFVPLFRRWKTAAPYPLFPRGGTHWSGYGVVRAADTLVRYLEQRGRFRLRDFRVGPPEVSTTPRYTDNDIAKALNLLWDPAPWPLAYPTVEFAPLQPGQRRPRLLLVGDSFGWGFIEFYPFVPELFAPGSHYWYYNREVQWTGATPDYHVAPEQYEVSSLNRREQLAAHDVVLVVVNEANLGSFDFGFSAELLQALATP